MANKRRSDFVKVYATNADDCVLLHVEHVDLTYRSGDVKSCYSHVPYTVCTYYICKPVCFISKLKESTGTVLHGSGPRVPFYTGFQTVSCQLDRIAK